MTENINNHLSSEGPSSGTALKLRSREFDNIPSLTSWDPKRGPRGKTNGIINDLEHVVVRPSQALLSSVNDNVISNDEGGAEEEEEEAEYGLILLMESPLDSIPFQDSLSIGDTPPISLLNPVQQFVEVEPPMYGSELAPDDTPLDLSALHQQGTMNVDLFPFFNMDGEWSSEEKKLMEIWRYELGEEGRVSEPEEHHQDNDSILVKVWQKLFQRGIYSPENQHIQNDPWYRITQLINSREDSQLHTPLTPPDGFQRFQVEDEENHVISYFPTY